MEFRRVLFRSLGEVPIDRDLAADLADPAANDPVFLSIGSPCRIEVGPAQQLAPGVKRRIAIEPVPLRAIPEIDGALRSGAAGKWDELRGGISRRGIGLGPVSVKPVAGSLHHAG